MKTFTPQTTKERMFNDLTGLQAWMSAQTRKKARTQSTKQQTNKDTRMTSDVTNMLVAALIILFTKTVLVYL